MPTREQVESVLRTVLDPEVGINVVDLGLVYGIDISPGLIHVRMTMTTPTCPVGGQLRDQAIRRLREQVPGAEAVEVELVWEPAWHPGLMSSAARHTMGWGG